jgi:hypothetical protein
MRRDSVVSDGWQAIVLAKEAIDGSVERAIVGGLSHTLSKRTELFGGFAAHALEEHRISAFPRRP